MSPVKLLSITEAEANLKILEDFIISPVFAFFDDEMEIDSQGLDECASVKPTDLATIIEREQFFGERRRHSAVAGYFLSLYAELKEHIQTLKEHQT